MAPLVPDIISNEFNFVVAILIGIAFGFVLEQAGFSSTKKLVGLFYGYDFTVLKVFFTAGTTAMIGVVLFIHWGMLDADLIYINPTYLRSAIIGGLIMGAGFVIGGFCPGTSLCALAIGKIDAFWFVFGSFFGILLFTENYPMLKSFYEADNMGNLQMTTILHLSKPLFAFLLTVVAIAAFVITQRIQDRINQHKAVYDKKQAMSYSFYALLPFVVIAIVAFTPNSNEQLLSKAKKHCSINATAKITADKLAMELVNNYYQINLIDTRSTAQYKKFHLPLAINIPIENMLARDSRKYFTQKYKTNVFYADNPETAALAYSIAKEIGQAECLVLQESTTAFKQQILNPQPPAANARKQDEQIYQFRSDASKSIMELAAKFNAQNTEVKKVCKKVKGGCS